MKKLILPGLTAVMLCMASPQESLNAQTPIIQTKFTADPAPMVHKGTVYLYTTHDEDYAPEGMAGFRMKEWLLLHQHRYGELDGSWNHSQLI